MPLPTPSKVRRLDPADGAGVAAHVEFQRAHGVPRHELPELLEWFRTVDAAVLLVADDPAGRLVGCATASTLAVLGSGSVQVNAFAADGDAHVLGLLADAVEAWEGAAEATELLAHVSGPTPQQEADWVAAGFEQVGVRSRLGRAVTAADANLADHADHGLAIVPLAERPELVTQALDVWNASHADIPTALPFGPVDEVAWREELDLDAGDPWPPSLLLAVTPAQEVAGVALALAPVGVPGVAGHRFTGVARSWRGRGVSTTLKRALIRWAATNGITKLVTSNDSANAPMLAVNARLGFEEQFRIVLFRRRVQRA